MLQNQLIPEPATVCSFESQGKSIRIEWFSPKDEQSPFVLLLHGNGSLSSAKDDFYRQIGKSFAETGLQAGILHYMDLFGVEHVSAEHFQRGDLAGYSKTINDALSYLQKNFGIRKTALFGHLLGAQLSLTQQLKPGNNPVTCVVSVSGSIVPTPKLGMKLPAVSNLPPVFFLHGDQDQVVPYESMLEMESFLKEMKTPYEKHIYHGCGHNLGHNIWIDVMRRSEEYLRRQLLLETDSNSIPNISFVE